MDSLNPFVLVLSGLPSLMQHLDTVHSQPLNQRIVMRYFMEPLDYIEHKLREAGAKMPIFAEDAIEAVSSLSHGWPRVIDQLCVNCLLLAGGLFLFSCKVLATPLS